MRADLRIVVVAVVFIPVAPPFARAQGLHGSVQVQYQRFDGPAGDVELWFQSIQLDHARRLGGSVDLASRLEVTDQRIVGRPERITLPRGTLRLGAPIGNVFASYRPIRVVDPVGTVTRQQESQVSGSLSLPKLPTVDASWVRRRQEAIGERPEAISDTRSANLSYSLGPLLLYAGRGEQRQEFPAARAREISQRNTTGGASLRFGVAGASLFAQYDFSEVTRGQIGVQEERNRSQGGSLTGSTRLGPQLDLNLNYGYRRSELRNRLRTALDSHDGALVLTYAPVRSLRFGAGGGVRTASTLDQEELLSYLLFTGSAEGTARPGLSTSASAARAVNRTPDGLWFSVDTYRGGSRMKLAQGLELFVDLQATANQAPSATVGADSAGPPARISTQGSIGASVTPLRGLSMTLSRQSYRVGRSYWTAMAHAVSSSFDLFWRPLPVFQLNGNLTQTDGLAPSDPLARTVRAGATWSPSAALQLTGSYSHSDLNQADPIAPSLPGRDIYSARLLGSVGRIWRASAGGSWIDPGRAGTTRQIDISLSRTFGG